MKRTLSRRNQFELLAALVAKGRPQEDVDWGSEHLWQQLVPLAELHRATAALPAGLRALGLSDQIPPQLAEFLATVHDLNTQRNLALRRQCLGVISQLQNAGVRAVPLKGLAYELMGLYADDPGGRMTIDIDVLVADHEAAHAQEALISSGYTPIAEYEVNRRYHHNYPRLVAPSGGEYPGSIEVHFRVGRGETDKVLPAHRVLSGATQIVVSGDRIEVPNAVDLVDHAVMHSAIGHVLAVRRTMRLRDVCDIYRLWQRAKSEGARISDLGCVQHKSAARYFGACLLLHGEPPEQLGELASPSNTLLRQILARQNVAERAAMEVALVTNGAMLLRDPARLITKMLRRGFYRAALSAAKSRTV